MNTQTLRNVVFVLHRYIGLAVGLIAIVVGLTGSLLVFHSEIAAFDQRQRLGSITPQAGPLPLEVILTNVKQTYANQSDVVVVHVSFPDQPTQPMSVALTTPEQDWLENYINPYTGAILGNSSKSSWVQQFFDIVLQLHYTLLAGDLGYKFVGIIGLLVTFMGISGILLWPGWRKLVTGFKIKWQGHPKRVNFDLHKVAGIVTVVFLLLTFFTGFCWSFYEQVNPIIYAATFSQPTPDPPVSAPVTGQAPLAISAQIQQAQAALPDGLLRSISLPQAPEEAMRVSFKLPHETVEYGQSNVYLDQYSGKVLRVDSSLEMSLGDRILNSFVPLHYGTFWGLPSRIFCVFVGIAPLILFITGTARGIGIVPMCTPFKT